MKNGIFTLIKLKVTVAKIKYMRLFYSLVFLISISLSSCEKVEGPGGTSSIAGKVWVKDYTTDFAVLKAEYWAEEEDIYIIYGSDTIHSDRNRTNFDGSYKFKYLNKGTYTLYAYSRDSSTINPSSSGRIPIKVQLTIDESGNDYIAPMLTILK